MGRVSGGEGSETGCFLSLCFSTVDTLQADAFLSGATPSLHPELSRVPHQGALTPLH